MKKTEDNPKITRSKSEIDSETDLEDDDDYDELDDIIEENVLRKRIKDLNSSGSESEDDLIQILGFEKDTPKVVVAEQDVDLIESAIQNNRKLKGMLERLESILIVKLRQFDLMSVHKSEEITETSTKVPEGDFFLRFTSPYFRDGQFPCPPNTEQLTKEQLNRSLYVHRGDHESWGIDDMTHLEDAIRDTIVQKFLNEVEQVRPLSGKPNVLQGIMSVRNNGLQDVLDEFNVVSIDWDIVTVQMVNAHTARDCEVFWNVYLKPSINKSFWDETECSDLSDIAKEYNYRNWDDIAEKLNTGRSGYLCFVQYHRCLEKTMIQWKKEDVVLLHKVVEACKVGDHINWSKVMYYCDGYDFYHLYYKYYKSFNSSGELPRKGKFDRNEDRFIVHAIKNEGISLSMLTKLLPSRNTVQIRDRYTSLTRYDRKTGSWTKDEDTKLLQLVEQYGTGSWAKVAKEMKNRTRVQVRQHYRHIQKVLHRNSDLTFETYRTRKIISKRKSNKSFMKSNIESNKIIKAIKKDKEETDLLKYFAHERKVLEMRQSISSTYETNREEVLAMCKILGVKFPANFSSMSVETKPWQEYIYEASKFVHINSSMLRSCHTSQKEGTVTFMPPNLVITNVLNNIYTRMNEQIHDFTKVGQSEFKKELPVFNTALKNWYKRLLAIFGSSLCIQDMSISQLQILINNEENK